MPGVEGDENEGWFIDPGTISQRSVAAAAAAAVNRQSGIAREVPALVSLASAGAARFAGALNFAQIY
jgi:hypothetical protein